MEASELPEHIGPAEPSGSGRRLRMHKWENGLGALTQIADAKLKLPPPADWAMKVTAPVLSTPDRKADHRAKDRSAALSKMKPA